MAYIDNRLTVPPPPDHPLFTVQLFYPNNISLAKQVSLYIKGHLHFEDRMIQTFEHEILFSGLQSEPANLVIVGVDEFCDLKEIFRAVQRCFPISIPIIAHLTAPIEMDKSILIDCSVIGSFIQYDFNTLASLMQTAVN